MKYFTPLILVFVLLFASCEKDQPQNPAGTLQLSSIKTEGGSLDFGGTSTGVEVNSSFEISFTSALDATAALQSIQILKNSVSTSYTHSFSVDSTKITLFPTVELDYSSKYVISISSGLKGKKGETFPGVSVAFDTELYKFELNSIAVNSQAFNQPQHPKDINYLQASIVMNFSAALNESNLEQKFTIYPAAEKTISLSADKKTITITTTSELDYYRKYTFQIASSLQSIEGVNFTGFSNYFYTGLNPTNKFPDIDDEALLDKVQLQTFKYFWDFAHPISGLTRERNTSGDIVTIGGSGFGIMALPIGVERGFITRQQAVSQLDKITAFLQTADRFHGVWPHWLNGVTGHVQPFSTNDNGGDLVETSYMAAGLLCVRQYLDQNVAEELTLINRINLILSEIEWDWYTRGGQNVLYWHWSPSVGWAMNMHVKGYNEALITYFMAATSTTHPIEASVYHNGWANSSYFVNGKTFYGIPLPLGFDYGGPLFFAHYSFLGLNPTGLSDQYANYWEQNVNHSLINYEHCVRNPYNKVGYSADCWGLTASDEPSGYGVHEPTRDNGTITPSAALSSIPYTPDRSMQAMRHFYFVLGDKLWGEYGFKDAFTPDQAWWASSYLAIDQGPIIVMIENHRSGLCWNLFMSAPEVQSAMNKLGFVR